MNAERGSVSATILIASVIILMAIGGVAYYLVQQQESARVITDVLDAQPTPTTNITSSTPLNRPADVTGSPPISYTSGKFSDFYCIKLPNDLHMNSGSSAANAAEIKQLQHFLNNSAILPDNTLEEDGVFGPLTAQKVLELKQTPYFARVKDRSATADHETRAIITDLTCEQNKQVEAKINFRVTTFDQAGKGSIVGEVAQINTEPGGPILAGSYGSINVVLDNPIQTNDIGIDFSQPSVQADVFATCGSGMTATARLSNIKQQSVHTLRLGGTNNQYLIMSAHLDSLKDVKLEKFACGE